MLGPRFGAFVLLLDMMKGLLAVVVVSRIRIGTGLPEWLGDEADAWVAVFAGAAALFGHVYTVFGRYFYGRWRGGKGVATGGGMLLGLVPIPVVIATLLFMGVVALTRFVSLGSIVAATSIPLTLLIEKAAGLDVAGPVLLLTIIVPVFILYTHRANLRRLLTGTERRLGQQEAEG